MSWLRVGAFGFAALLLTMMSIPVSAELRGAVLKGYEEVPAISTQANGLFAAFIADDGSSIAWTLVYSGLEGGTVSAAHIHLGQPAVAGAIVIHFCGTGGKPPCPPSPGTLQGTSTAADVVAVPAQGIAAGEIAEVVRAIREGQAYVNVHTTPAYPAGEIRGQIK
jgi:CHRD domain-containing protein